MTAHPMQPTQATAERRRRPQRSPMSSATTALGWGTLGFILGALCWHLLGFWSFVSGVVLKGGDEARTIERTEPARQSGAIRDELRTGRATPVRLITPGIPSIKVSPAVPAAPCTAAGPDRGGGTVDVADCPAGAAPTLSKPIAPKGDLVLNPSQPSLIPAAPMPPAGTPATAWSTTISTTTP